MRTDHVLVAIVAALLPPAIAVSDLISEASPQSDRQHGELELPTGIRATGVSGFYSGRQHEVGSNPISIAAADIDGDGDTDLVAANKNSNDCSILVNRGLFGFASELRVDVGAAPSAVILGDVDLNGFVDIACASTASGSIRVLRADGAGAFLSVDEYPVNAGLRGIAFGHVNQDGRLDLVAATTDGAFVLLNLGAGLFSQPVLVRPGFFDTVALADMDGDGDHDLVLGSQSGSTGTNFISINNGVGTFAHREQFLGGSTSIAITDLDNDGDLDIVGKHDQRTIAVLLNNGDATFAPRKLYDVNAFGPTAIAAADLNGDGLPDIAVSTNAVDKGTRVLLNSGSGQFLAPIACDTGDAGSSILAADLDNDGDLDIATANGSSDLLTVAHNDGAGAFPPWPQFEIATSARSVVAADIDGDGDLDVVAGPHSGDSVRVFKNNGHGELSLHVALFVPVRPASVALGDVNGDGMVDLVMTFFYSNAGVISVWPGDGTGGFLAPTTFSVAFSTFTTWLRDIDGDGDLDMISAGAVSPVVGLLFNDGHGIFTTPTTITLQGPVAAIAAEDIDGDGDCDLACTIPSLGAVQLLTNDGFAHYSMSEQLTAGVEPAAIRIADLDGDGILDIAVANRGVWTPAILAYLNDGVSVLRGLGGGTFEPLVSYKAGVLCVDLSIADVDADGALDLVVANRGSANVTLLRNDGLGVFPSREHYVSNGRVGGLSSVICADFNGDNSIDLCIANLDLETLTIVPNRLRLLPRCPADVDGDAHVTTGDFVVLAGHYGAAVSPGTLGDLNSDGIVNAADFVILAANFGCGP